MIRTLLGIIVSLIAMSMLVFALSIAPWFVLGVDSVLLPGRFDTNAAYNVYAIVVGAMGAVFGGWLCARISRSRMAVVVLAVLGFVGGMVNVYAHHTKPEPGPRVAGVAVNDAVMTRREPTWFTVLMPVLGVPGVLIGGRRAGR
jgi:hypothetical protein